MAYSFLRAALFGGLFIVMSACKAGEYDLPACEDKEECGNGIDDDCDGIKDNPDLCNCPSFGATQSCPPRPGIVTQAANPASRCKDEEQYCDENLQWGVCKGIDPVPEKCANGVDDDCDGTVDEPGCLVCVDNEERVIYDPKLDYGLNSECKPAIEACRGGRWEIVSPARGPAAHDATCDGKDNDCDGRVDEDVVWRSGVTSFAKGKSCWDTSKFGACRTVGTVVCSGGIATCDNMPQSAQTAYRRQPSSNAFVDANNLNSSWDWDCDDVVESVFCSGTGSTCSGGNISGTIYVTLGASTDCSIARTITGCNAVLIRPTAGSFIQCGTAVTITDCNVGGPFNCSNGSERSGYLYCK